MTTRQSIDPARGAPGHSADAKLAQLCDADRRRTDRSTAAVAKAISADSNGVNMPDPYGYRTRHQAVLDSVRELLLEEPSPRTIRTATSRMVAAIAALGDRLAKEMERDRDQP